VKDDFPMRLAHLLLSLFFLPYTQSTPLWGASLQAKAAELVARWESLDGPTLAHGLVCAFLTEQEWESRVKELLKSHSQWKKDYDHDLGRYLNDRLVAKALQAAGGEPEKIKEGMIWLAYYKELKQQEPEIIRTFLKEHKASLSKLLQNFTWEKATEYVKMKKWREDKKQKDKENGSPEVPKSEK
jgi:hypothetical protein